jgi:hypothetical protein
LKGITSISHLQAIIIKWVWSENIIVLKYLTSRAIG